MMKDSLNRDFLDTAAGNRNAWDQLQELQQATWWCDQDIIFINAGVVALNDV